MFWPAPPTMESFWYKKKNKIKKKSLIEFWLAVIACVYWGLTFVVNLSVSVNVCFSDHLVNLFVGQLFPKVCHDVTQFSCADVPVPILKHRIFRSATARVALASYSGTGRALPYQRHGMLLWSPPRCLCPSSSSPSWSGTLGSLSSHFLCTKRMHLDKPQLLPLNTQDVDVLTISVHFIDHVLQLSLRRVLSERAHDSTQLFSCDGAITVLVKEWESLFEFCR